MPSCIRTKGRSRFSINLVEAVFMLLVVLIGGMLFRSPAAFAEQPAEISGEPTRSYGAIDVILYQTSWCPYCTKAREYLMGTGVSLVIYDIERDPERRREMMAKSGSPGVPVVDVEGIVIRGFSPEAMLKAIERKRRE
jgi:mycoredoxin